MRKKSVTDPVLIVLLVRTVPLNRLGATRMILTLLLLLLLVVLMGVRLAVKKVQTTLLEQLGVRVKPFRGS